MTAFILYLVKLCAAITLVSLFYRLVLRKHTFYNWNRWYLLLYPLLCFALPFIDVTASMEQVNIGDGELWQSVPAVEELTGLTTAPAPSEAPGKINWQTSICMVLLGGVLIFLLRHFLMYVSLYRLRREAQLISDGEVKVYQVQKNIIPFSFGNSIFIHSEQQSRSGLEEIIRHEFIHVKQKHTIDIVYSEILCALLWFHPFAWAIRKDLKQNLEFIADEEVLRSGVDRIQYQYLLLQVMGTTGVHIAAPFNFSSLKKRIVMMNKMPSARIHLLKFLFLLPLCCVMLVAFRGVLQQQQQQTPMKQSIPSSPSFKTTEFYVAGRIVESGSFGPKAGFPLKLTINKKTLTLKTDANGFYYYRDDLTRYSGIVHYELALADPAYYPGSGGTAVKDSATEGYFHLTVVTPKSKKGRSVSHEVNIALRDVVGADDPRSKLYELLTQGGDAVIARLRVEGEAVREFRKAHPNPADWITEYKGMLFWKDGRVIGRRDSVKFYLMETRVDYFAVNEKFRESKSLPESFGSYREGIGWLVLGFETDDFNKPTPPQHLLTSSNRTSIPVDEFVYESLVGKIVYVNGKRKSRMGTIGWYLGREGERKKNRFHLEQKRITNVYRYTGALAAYYDSTATEIIWVEIKPEATAPPRVISTSIRAVAWDTVPVAHVPSKQKYPPISFTADTLRFGTTGENLFHFFASNMIISEGDSIQKVDGSFSVMPEYISINAENLQVVNDYVYAVNSRFTLRRLDPDEAIRKYGAEAKNGAIEVTIAPR